MKEIIYYAQNREDLIISSFFPDIKNGFYIDVGAADPVEDSVTKYFYEKGWSGVNIEPIKSLYKKLNKSRKRDLNLNIGISSSPGRLTLREYENYGISTFSSTSKKENVTDKFTDYEVEVQTLEQIFETIKGKKVNFLKVDVEGYEYEVLEGNDWDKFRPELICVESNHRHRDWRPLLEDNNYQKVFFDGLNDYYLANESRGRFKVFRKIYPELLISRPIVGYSWKKLIEKTEGQLEKVQANLDSHIDLNERMEVVNRHLEDELGKFQKVGYTTKHLLKLGRDKMKRSKRI